MHISCSKELQLHLLLLCWTSYLPASYHDFQFLYWKEKWMTQLYRALQVIHSWFRPFLSLSSCEKVSLSPIDLFLCRTPCCICYSVGQRESHSSWHRVSLDFPFSLSCVMPLWGFWHRWLWGWIKREKKRRTRQSQNQLPQLANC